MINRIFKSAVVAAGALAATTVLGGCNMDFELPPVELQIPLATGVTVPEITKADDKLTFPLPEICDLPDLAQIEADVREALGRAGGLLDIDSITIDEIEFDATVGNFDFLDEVAFILRNDGESAQLSADLSGQSNVTSFSALPEEGEEPDFLELLPGQDECLDGEVVFNGSIPSETTVYNAVMHITIRSTLHL